MNCELCFAHEANGVYRVTDSYLKVTKRLALCQMCVRDLKDFNVRVERIEEKVSI